MEKDANPTKSLGQAIDDIVRALQPLDEASRITAIKASCEHLKIELEGKKEVFVKAEDTSPPFSKPTAQITDIRTLKEQKLPTTANEMAAIVAYYLEDLAPETDRKQEVGVEDMIKYFKQAGFPLPKGTKDLLNNAKIAGYFDSTTRGKFKLNPVGYNLVVHNLPRSKAVSSKKPSKGIRRRPAKTK